ncbi:protein BASIC PENTACYSTEINE7-like [Chenopodium quinoa]|uniref:GAGA-binding transcriptional activator n=1 Tax=Chenopodium quinoa TaxID=63459 RepID=A0A803LTR7_CHEQI|nr:protein BASIC PENTACYSTEINE7-like [Chenopodium quinoa]XP_021765543.1 protein BASIC PENTACYSTEINE7-like [Chenopodium quinoa]
MGTFRSNYPIIPEGNRSRSVPHFSWFHPGNYLAATRNGFNPFQGTQHNPEGALSAMPIRCMPINEAANIVVDDEPQPSKPAKKPKTSKKTSDDAAPKERKPKIKKSKAKSGSSAAKRERKSLNSRSNESSTDASGIPAPVCSCTGAARQCYRWGSGGWQSSCCTTNISEYPLPMSATRPGSRTAGRKMSHGAYDKLFQRLAAEGYDFTLPIDLKDHWAKHGTNKFVTIK